MKRVFARIITLAMIALAVTSCSRSTNATSPDPGIALERVAGTLVERNTEQMALDGPLVLVIAERPGQLENAVIPGTMRGDVTPAERAVAEKAFQLPIGSYVVALGKRGANGDLVVSELRGGF